MDHSAPKVLRVNSVEEADCYLSAVHKILVEIQREHGQTLAQIADRIDVSLGTVSNAANKKAALNPMFLSRLGMVYGPATLAPFAALFGGRIEPIEPHNPADILPFIARAGLKIAEARDPASPGGVREIHTERLAFLPYLKKLIGEAQALVVNIERENAA